MKKTLKCAGSLNEVVVVVVVVVAVVWSAPTHNTLSTIHNVVGFSPRTHEPTH